MDPMLIILIVVAICAALTWVFIRGVHIEQDRVLGGWSYLDDEESA